jgi:hypothetical protein
MIETYNTFYLWETINNDPPPVKITLEFMPENELHPEQLTITDNPQYPALDCN